MCISIVPIEILSLDLGGAFKYYTSTFIMCLIEIKRPDVRDGWTDRDVCVNPSHGSFWYEERKHECCLPCMIASGFKDHRPNLLRYFFLWMDFFVYPLFDKHMSHEI